MARTIDHHKSTSALQTHTYNSHPYSHIHTHVTHPHPHSRYRYDTHTLTARPRYIVLEWKIASNTQYHIHAQNCTYKRVVQALIHQSAVKLHTEPLNTKTCSHILDNFISGCTNMTHTSTHMINHNPQQESRKPQ